VNGILPPGLGVSLYRRRVGWPVLKVSGFHLGLGMPRKEFAEKLNVLVDFFVE
jgi:hypothetical protein